ncbi:MAG: hypothetical protein HY898_27220 [Deltaproteobacteria bacterium]|nr:hypothetical protein [Deltaproteobacteria bacterium]
MLLLPRRNFLLALLPVAAAMAVATSADPTFARRRPKVVWTEVQVPEGDHQTNRERQLRNVLKREGHRVQWGDPPDGLIEASVKVTEFVIDRRPDVVRVTCSAVGRLGKGPAVKTHFSFGGHPKKEAALESQMLTLVGRGVVARLASLSRERHKVSKID